ncbi:hypothetical protein [Streptomyces virginiae]|uniref:hypothetical protein n=1 Tax=Streptomyces virginiae TaxID=1961 RepID=UPI0036B71DBC
MTLLPKSESLQSWIVLDVDRTLFNTTSWFHACSTPGILLDHLGVKEFLQLNERAYGAEPDLTETEFRARTLQLIDASPLGPWTMERFEEAGAAVAAGLALYPEVSAYLRQLNYRPRQGQRVLFLSAGHQPFILGVVRALLTRYFLDGLPYDVIGSDLRFVAGRCVAGEGIDGARKAQVVRGLLAAGARIELVADDNYHDTPLFSLVEESGGRALRVLHQPGARSSRSWREFLEDLGEVGLQARISSGPENYALADVDHIFDRYARELAHLPTGDHGIGVGSLSVHRFDQVLNDLCAAAAVGDDEQNELGCLLRRLVHAEDGHTLLRGGLFHLSAPPYLFPESSTQRERWHQALDTSLACLSVLEKGGILGRWRSLPLACRWIALIAFDHLKNAATHALDILSRVAVSGEDANLLDEEIEQLVEDCHAAYWSAVFTEPRVEGLLDASAWIRLRQAVDECPNTPFVMRELDDPRIIAVSALHLADQLERSGDWPTGVIDFPSGALELGLAFRVITRLTRPDLPEAELVHMAYSSKNVMRGLESETDFGFDYLVTRIPKHAQGRLHEWLSTGRSILLYDNNATTFSTLANVKQVLRERTSGAVRATVACVNYENLTHHLLGTAKEPLCEGWQEVLDVRPVADYVTAFATWGTSIKTQTLHSMYTVPATPPANLPDCHSGDSDQPGWMFKVCRVHNIFDLASVVRAGANMIGVHAVSPLGDAYEDSQTPHRPILAAEPGPSDMPLAHYETGAIRAMATALPNGLTIALVVENTPARGELRRLLDNLGLPTTSLVQLQCRVTEEDVTGLKAEGVAGLICAIGTAQADFDSYFAFLDAVLDPDTDLVLVDSSHHQPDLMAAEAPRSASSPAPGELRNLGSSMAGNRVPVLVADDVSATELLDRCREWERQGVIVAGCDTQNSVEVAKAAQRYRLVGPDGSIQALIRKSPDRLAAWAAASAERSTPNHPTKLRSSL